MIPPEQLDRLFSFLFNAGFLRNVEDRLRTDILIRRFESVEELSQLETILAPVVARSPEQLKTFGELFEAFVKAESKPPDVSPPPPGKAAVERVRNEWRALAGLGATVVALAAVLLLIRPQPPDIAPVPVKIDSVVDSAPPPVTPVLDTLLDAPDALLRGEVDSVAEPAGRPTGWALAAALLLFVLLAVLVRHRRLQSQAIVVKDRVRRDTAPYIWKPHPRPRREAFWSETFRETARHLQRRQRLHGVRLDVERTIRATVQALGFPTPRFVVASRPPEYLLLIARSSSQDQQARFFDELGRRLNKEGAFIRRFFFEEDPRVCFAAESSEAVTLDELAHRYHEHRVILFASGQELVDPVFGELHDWTTSFAAWNERAILSPVSTAGWGRRERSLSRLFLLLPGTLLGLRTLVHHFETGTTPDISWWRTRMAERHLELSEDVEPDITELRATLGEEAFGLLLACAVYPELYWELTRYFASIPDLGPELPDDESLLRVVRLPWFRNGIIPPDVRRELLAIIPPAMEQRVRSALLDALAFEPPAVESAAGRKRESEVILQDALLRLAAGGDGGVVRDRLTNLPRALLNRDPVTIRKLSEARSTPADRMLPQRLRRWIFRNGTSILGFRPWTGRAAAVVFALGSVPYLVSALLPPNTAAPAPVLFKTVRAVRVAEKRSLTLPEAAAYDAAGTRLTDSILWSSVDPSRVAVVSRRLEGIFPGETEIGVRARNALGRIPVRVLSAEDLKSVAGSPFFKDSAFAEITLGAKRIAIGERRRLLPSGIGRGAEYWTHCESSAATVDSSGIVTGHANGEAAFAYFLDNLVVVQPVLVTGTRDPATIDTLARAAVLPLSERQSLVRPVHFDFDRSDIRDDARLILDRKIEVLKRYPAITIRVAAHTHTQGASEYNLQLGRRYAASIKRYLVDGGIAEGRIETMSFGEDRPLKTAIDECSQAMNRRVEFAITGGGEVLQRRPDVTARRRAGVLSRPVRQNNVGSDSVAAVRRSDSLAAARLRDSVAVASKADNVIQAPNAGVLPVRPPPTTVRSVPDWRAIRNLVLKQQDYAIDTLGNVSLVPSARARPFPSRIFPSYLARHEVRTYPGRGVDTLSVSALQRGMLGYLEPAKLWDPRTFGDSVESQTVTTASGNAFLSAFPVFRNPSGPGLILIGGLSGGDARRLQSFETSVVDIIVGGFESSACLVGIPLGRITPLEFSSAAQVPSLSTRVPRLRARVQLDKSDDLSLRDLLACGPTG